MNIPAVQTLAPKEPTVVSSQSVDEPFAYEFKRPFNNQTGSLSAIAHLIAFQLNEVLGEGSKIDLTIGKPVTNATHVLASTEQAQSILNKGTHESVVNLRNLFHSADICIVTADVENGQWRVIIGRDGAEKITDNAAFDYRRQYGIIVPK